VFHLIGFHPRLSAGIEYNPRADEVAPLVNFLVLPETRVFMLVTYNGVQVHPLLNYSRGRHTLSLVMVKGRDLV
jgi:hypothetical protein